MKRTLKNLLAAGIMLAALTPLAQAAEPTPLNWVFTSDPQYPWTDKTDRREEQSSSELQARSKELINAQYSSVADFRRAHGGAAAVPVMINGDMTAFGHGWQRDVVFPLIAGKLEDQFDFGLGNHDYANNIDDCFLNNCAADSIKVLMDRYWGQVDMDLVARDVDGVITYFGSLAYSRDYGDVHVVQLNNEPTYKVDFDAGLKLTFNRRDFRISDAFEWLEKDLAQARSNGRVIIINMHNPTNWEAGVTERLQFARLIERYKVTAVFAGHLHFDLGVFSDKVKFGSVPAFTSGSASQQTYLTADFSADLSTLTVSGVRNNDWRKREVISTVQVRR